MSSSMFDLRAPFFPCGDQPKAIDALLEGLSAKRKFQTLLGVTGSGKTYTIANVIAKYQKKVLVLAHNKTLAAQLYSEFRSFFPNNAVEYFVSYYDYYQPEAYVPGSDTYIEKDSAINDEIDRLRHSATRSLLEREDVIVVASVSCIYGIGSPKEYESQKIILLKGDVIDRDDLLKKLVAIQYIRNDIDFFRGTFRVRGDVVEIFPPYEDSKVIRISFWGDEIEEIVFADPLRGQVVAAVSSVAIYPKSHYVVGQEKLQKAIHDIKVELRERLSFFEKENKLVERQRLETRTMLDLEMLEEMGFCTGIENYSRHLTQTPPGNPPPTLLDFFEKDFLLVVDESHMTIPQVAGMFRGDRSRKQNLVDYGFRLPSALDNRPLNFDEFVDRLDKVICVSATPAEFELTQSKGEFVEQLIRPTGLLDPVIEIRDASKQVDDLLKQLQKTISSGYRVLVTTLTKRMAEDLTRFLSENGIKVRYLHSDVDTLERIEIIQDLRRGVFDVLVGINLLREGLDIPEVALVAILDADKEGFLRSERALIQTIGRAARNEQGKVILYANQETPSMRRAIDETNRRRMIQHQFNSDHHIIPKSIHKDISGGVIETLRREKNITDNAALITCEKLNPEMIEDRILELREKMQQAGRQLRFEDAIKYREEIKKLTEVRITLS